MSLIRSRFGRSELVGHEVYSLVTIQWAGQTIRMSTQDLRVISSVEGPLDYVGCLTAIDIEAEIDLFSVSASSASIAISGVWPVDVPALCAAGHDLSAATAEVAQWAEGTAWEARVVRLVGRLRDPEYGAAEEPTNASIEEEVWADLTEMPSATEQVDTTTWDFGGLLDADIGLSYPIVIGQPGYMGYTGSQALWVAELWPRQQLLLCVGSCDATTVRINIDSDPGGIEVAVDHTVDLLGQPVSVIDLVAINYLDVLGGGVPAAYYASGTSIYVMWVNGGGLRCPDGSLLRAAGDVVEWAMGRLSSQYDRGRTAVARALLTGYQIDGVIDERIGVWDWLSSALLPLLPVSICRGSKGIYPVVWRYDATAADAVLHLDVQADPRIERVGRIKIDSSKIFNSFKLSYQYSMRTGTYQAVTRLGVAPPEVYATAAIRLYTPGDVDSDRVRLTARQPGHIGADIAIQLIGGGGLALVEDPSAKTWKLTFNDAVTTTQDIIGVASTMFRLELMAGKGTDLWAGPSGSQETTSVLGTVDETLGSVECAASQLRYAREPGSRFVSEKSIESALVYDPSTAALMLGWMARAYAFARRTIQYMLPPDLGWLSVGDVVTLSDTDLRLSGQVALVSDLQRAADGVIGARLLLVESIPLDLHEVS